MILSFNNHPLKHNDVTPWQRAQFPIPSTLMVPSAAHASVTLELLNVCII